MQDDDPLPERRSFLGSLLGASVGVSVLAGCVDDAAPAPAPTDPLALVGTTPVKWVDTLADLASTAGCIQSEVVIARGHSTVNDGGGGVFSWDATSTTGHDHGTVIVPTSGCGGAVNGRWLRLYSGALDVRWFGARAGSAAYAAQNDLAITRALAVAAPPPAASVGVDAGRIFFPQGQWYVSATIAITQDDSVILEGPGGAGSWGAAGAYDHHSAKLLWCGTTPAPMIRFTSTMRCGVVGLMLDGGGSASCGIRVTTVPGAPAKGNFFEDVVIDNLGANAVGFHLGNPPAEPVGHDVAFNRLRHFWISGGAVGVLQEGHQSVSNVYEDGVFTYQTSTCAKLVQGDVTIARCFFRAAAEATADVHVGVEAQYARFVHNTHETICPIAYQFAPTGPGVLRPMATLLEGVRVLYQRSTGATRRILDFQQDGHLTLLGCTFDGATAANAPQVYIAPPYMAHADVGLVTDIGCRYLNGAHAVVAPIGGVYQSLFSNHGAAPAPFTPVLAENLSTGTSHKLHNGKLLLQDNNNTSATVLGTRFTTYLGQLSVSSDQSTPRPDGMYLLTLDNAGASRVLVNAAGGPHFFHNHDPAAPPDPAPPTARPVVSGSRAGNPALASLLSALAQFGLIKDTTTA